MTRAGAAMLTWQFQRGTLCQGGYVTPVFKQEMLKIEEQCRQVRSSSLLPFQKEERLAALTQKAEIYGVIAYSNDKCVLAGMTELEAEDFAAAAFSTEDFANVALADEANLTDREFKTLDALYVYTREKAFLEEGDFTLSSGANILKMDAFDEARYLHFSAARWWRSHTDDSMDLCGMEDNFGLQPASAHLVVIEPATPIRRWEIVMNGVRSQTFGPDIFTHLVAVVRQWVEEDGDDPESGFAAALQNNPKWQSLVSAESHWPMDNPIAALIGKGLPYTPSVQDYLKQEYDSRLNTSAVATMAVSPRRGGLVTTFVLAGIPDGYENVQTRIIQQINPSGGAGWVTDKFYNLARKCLVYHEKWSRALNLGALDWPKLPHGKGDGRKVTYKNSAEMFEARFVEGNTTITDTIIKKKMVEERKAKANDAPVSTDVEALFRSYKSRWIGRAKKLKETQQT